MLILELAFYLLSKKNLLFISYVHEIDVGKQQSLEDNGKAHSAQVHGANDLNAAKFAAMRAAELGKDVVF